MGPLAICEIYQAGVHTGLLITCNRHMNHDDRHNAKCCKRVVLGGTSVGEVKRRLKRWYVAGLAEEDNLPITTTRSTHLRMGGPLLRGYADDDPVWRHWPDERLDALIMAP